MNCTVLNHLRPATTRQLCIILFALCTLFVILEIPLLSTTILYGYSHVKVRGPSAIEMLPKSNTPDGQQYTNKSKHPTTESQFMQKQALVQISRKRALREACRKHPELRSRDGQSIVTTLHQLLVMDKNKILYCIVPKVGCSNWKRLFMVLEGHRDNAINITTADLHFHNNLRTPSTMLPAEINRVLKVYRKFFYVRHPFVRLISAYRNKIKGRQPFRQGENLQFVDIARNIVLKYRKGALLTMLTEGNLNVSWDEWIRYLTDPSNTNGFNSHWQEMYKLCSPCSIPFDFIGNLETVEADSRYMFNVWGLENVSYPTIHRSRESSTDLFGQFFANVSRKDLQRLWEIYKLDFELFGYAKPDKLDNGSS